MNLIREKLEQAVGILRELEIDAWLTFVRETGEGGDPVLPLILGRELTWQSALIVTRAGRRIALVGNYDADGVKHIGAWDEVVPYVHGVREILLAALREIAPASLAINYSTSDVKADGLSHGMYLLLREFLSETDLGEKLVSAEGIIGALRGRKTPGEIECIRRAIDTTDKIFAAVPSFARVGVSEADIARFMKKQAEVHGVGLAWEPSGCPIVNSGPESSVGHSTPSETIRVQPGHVLHIDFGVRQDGFCSDIQSCWYVPKPGETEPPAHVMHAFDAVVRSIRAAAAALRPGVEGWTVDAAARQTLVDAGYPEYLHGTGHQLGRAAHDGGGGLSPRWERYGDTPYRKVEVGNVFTLELGIENIPGAGYIGLEEDVVVTPNGCEFLSKPQDTLPLLK